MSPIPQGHPPSPGTLSQEHPGHRVGMATQGPWAIFPEAPPSSADLKIPWIILFREKNYNHEGQNTEGNGILPQAPGRHGEDNREIRASTKVSSSTSSATAVSDENFHRQELKEYYDFLWGINHLASCYLLLEAWHPITLLHKAPDVHLNFSFERKMLVFLFDSTSYFLSEKKKKTTKTCYSDGCWVLWVNINK